MKKSASLIQVSRGGVVDEEALAEAIRNSQIRGAAVDVFSEEPPKKDNPLLKLEQVILTPHIGSNTVECMDGSHWMWRKMYILSFPERIRNIQLKDRL